MITDRGASCYYVTIKFYHPCPPFRALMQARDMVEIVLSKDFPGTTEADLDLRRDDRVLILRKARYSWAVFIHLCSGSYCQIAEEIITLVVTTWGLTVSSFNLWLDDRSGCQNFQKQLVSGENAKRSRRNGCPWISWPVLIAKMVRQYRQAGGSLWQNWERNGMDEISVYNFVNCMKKIVEGINQRHKGKSTPQVYRYRHIRYSRLRLDTGGILNDRLHLKTGFMKLQTLQSDWTWRGSVVVGFHDPRSSTTTDLTSVVDRDSHSVIYQTSFLTIGRRSVVQLKFYPSTLKFLYAGSRKSAERQASRIFSNPSQGAQ